MIRILLAITLVFMLSCSPIMGDIDPSINREEVRQGLIIYTYPSIESLERLVGMPVEEPKLRVSREQYHNNCIIHIVKPYTLKEDDDFTMLLGHGIMHCLYGEYHK